VANVVFADVQDWRGNRILSARDQNKLDLSLRRIRLMTLMHLFLIERYKAARVHYLSPTDDNRHPTERMKQLGIFSSVNMEAGLIIAAAVDSARVAELLKAGSIGLQRVARTVRKTFARRSLSELRQLCSFRRVGAVAVPQ